MVNDTELISVIVPIYNSEKYLKRCIDSIVFQSYKNIEILLIDDGSTDSSGLLCDKYVQQDNRIIVSHISNGGVSKARNFAINKAKGKYICFIDSDDWVEPDMIEYLYSLIVNSDCAIAACGIETNYSYILNNDYKNCKLVYTGEKAFQYVWDNPFLCNKIFLRQIILENNLFLDERIIVSEDSLFCFKVIEQKSKIIVGDSVKYHYFQDNDFSATHKPWSIKQVNSLYGYKYMAEHAKMYNLPNCKIYECGYVNQCIRMLLHKPVSYDKELLKKIRKPIRKYIFVYFFTNGCRLKKHVRKKFKLLALFYSVFPWRFAKRISKY